MSVLQRSDQSLCQSHLAINSVSARHLLTRAHDRRRPGLPRRLARRATNKPKTELVLQPPLGLAAAEIGRHPRFRNERRPAFRQTICGRRNGSSGPSERGLKTRLKRAFVTGLSKRKKANAWWWWMQSAANQSLCKFPGRREKCREFVKNHLNLERTADQCRIIAGIYRKIS